MSSIFQIIARLVAGLFASERPTPDVDAMSLHDWADLPAHHPLGNCAPR